HPAGAQLPLQFIFAELAQLRLRSSRFRRSFGTGSHGIRLPKRIQQEAMKGIYRRPSGQITDERRPGSVTTSERVRQKNEEEKTKPGLSFGKPGFFQSEGFQPLRNGW